MRKIIYCLFAVVIAAAYSKSAVLAVQDGAGEIEIGGELKQWHKVTLTLDGPFASESGEKPNPFLDYRFTVVFKHESGDPAYEVPGYFAADGDAAETSADSGTRWRAHLSPDKPGKWSYEVTFVKGKSVAVDREAAGDAVVPFHGKTGNFEIGPTDKTGRDLRGKGRLEYVGRHHLRFAGDGEYFLKAGADAPETLLAFRDFDGTRTNNAKKGPLKSWEPHVKDWKSGDATWQGAKGKGLIGAINYLSGKGCNVFSFLTYNAGGDGDNVWPFVERDDKLHYDCSKLDQWQIVFDHGQRRGMYLHFKLQETENDDNRRGHNAGGGGKGVRESLDGGDLGVERKLYMRELIARFGYALALNWNLGEENTQSTAQQRAMARYIHDTDPYDHIIVVHTFPNQQDQVYKPLLGDGSKLSGASLQNSSVKDSHWQVVKWVKASAESGKRWIIAFDEPGTATTGEPPDPDYPGVDPNTTEKEGKPAPTIHDVRKYALWGTLMGGGAGVEYYFGYKFPQNDLNCEDWRSRDRSWEYCHRALSFFRENDVPFWEMKPRDDLVGNPKSDNSRYCLAKPGQIYLVYLPEGGSASLDLAGGGAYEVSWFNPRTGGELVEGTVKEAKGGNGVSIGVPPGKPGEDWLALVRK